MLSHYASASTIQEGGFNEEQLIAADVNLDGIVDAVDASCILAYYAYASTASGNIVSIAEFIRSRANKAEEFQVLSSFSAEPHYIYINTEETVKFTVKSAESFPNDTVSLYDENNNFVSYMFDDGTNGDEKANDGIYSKDIVLGSDDFDNIKYYAAAGKYKSDKRNICFYRDLTEDDLNGTLAILDDMNGLTFEDACTYIKSSDKVRIFSIDEENSSISFQSIYGYHALWTEDSEEDIRTCGRGQFLYRTDEYEINEEDFEKGNYSIIQKLYDYTLGRLKECDIKLAKHSKKKVAVLKQTKFKYNADVMVQVGDCIAQTLNLGSSEYKNEDEIRDSQLTVLDADETDVIEELKHLNDYNTVIFDAHGGYFEHNDEYVCNIAAGVEITKEEKKQIKLNQHKYSQDVSSYNLVICGENDPETNKIRYELLFTPGFISDYYPGSNDLSDSLWILGDCHSLQNDGFYTALHNAGAKTVIGFSNTVSELYRNNVVLETLINGMILSADTANDSLREAELMFGRTDPYIYDKEKIITEPVIRGDLNYRFVDEISLKDLYEIESTPGPISIGFPTLDTGTSSDKRTIEILQKLYDKLDGAKNATYMTYAGEVGLAFGRKYKHNGLDYGTYESFDEIINCARSIEYPFELIRKKAYNPKYPLADVGYYYDNNKDPYIHGAGYTQTEKKDADNDNEDELIKVLHDTAKGSTFNLFNIMLNRGVNNDHWYTGNCNSIITVIKDDYYYDTHNSHYGWDHTKDEYKFNYFKNKQLADEKGITIDEKASGGGYVFENHIFYIIDLREGHDYDLDEICKQSGGRYVKYSEANLDYLIDLINKRR